MGFRVLVPQSRQKFGVLWFVVFRQLTKGGVWNISVVISSLLGACQDWESTCGYNVSEGAAPAPIVVLSRPDAVGALSWVLWSVLSVPRGVQAVMPNKEQEETIHLITQTR